MESAYIHPVFPNLALQEELLAVLLEIQNNFMSKLKRISQMAGAIKKERTLIRGKDSELKKLNEVLDMGIAEIWSEF